MPELTKLRCEACNAMTPKLTAEQIAELSGKIPGWTVVDDELYKAWKFKNFMSSLAFVNAVGALAEVEGHHPDISFGWGYVEIFISTHAIKGLSTNDFILAAKIDTLPSAR